MAKLFFFVLISTTSIQISGRCDGSREEEQGGSEGGDGHPRGENWGLRIRAKGYLSFSICAIKSEENNLSLLVSMDKEES